MVAPDSRVIRSDFQVTFPAHSDIIAHIIGTGINARYHIFLTAQISLYRDRITDCYSQVRGHKLCHHDFIICLGSPPFHNVEPLRIGDCIGRIINSVHRHPLHRQEVTVRNAGIGKHSFFRFLRGMFPKNLDADIVIRRIECIHHPFSVRSQPGSHPSDHGGKEHQKDCHNTGPAISSGACGKLTERHGVF